MKVMFICEAAVQNNELRCASWIKSLASHLGEAFALILASPLVAENALVRQNGRQIMLVPFYADIKAAAGQIQAVSPEVIVIFGTEKSYTLSAVKACQAAGVLAKTALFAQGICRACAAHYADGVPSKIVRRYTFRDVLRRQNIQREQQMLVKKAEDERQAVAMVPHFIGRTSLDRALAQEIHPNAHYYACNDILRECFYSGSWNPVTMEKHRIFISQFYYPIKGFHYLLEAAAQLREAYPDFVIVAAGYNPIHSAVDKNELKDSSYIRYIKSLIQRYQLQKHIVLPGELSEDRMKEAYLKANVFVMPSTIENSPNSLAEAMMLGVPCIAADVGGIADLASSPTEALIYPSSDTRRLAEYISNVFDNPSLAASLSQNGKDRAERLYDRTRNIKAFEQILTDIQKSPK